jgi:uncharacterized protein
MKRMDILELVDALSKPEAYPYPVRAVEARQTHISAVFLSGTFVYKIKKPVDLGFVDFSTLDARHHFCEEEVRLNQRLAPNIYLGVVPVVQTGEQLQFEGKGEAIEWAVKMQRLPDDATLKERIRRGEIGADLIEALARRIAAFHQQAETNERIASFGRFELVARTIRDIFDQAEPQVGTTVSGAVFNRIKTLMENALTRLRPLIEARAARQAPRDCHGDLHLDHIYYFPDQPPPTDLVMIDCIEFNERFRFIDPIADMAFLAMDLAFLGRRDLRRAFLETYFQCTGDQEGRALLPLYAAYRATVRGMVEGLELGEKEVPQAEHDAALERARAHWLLALTELEEPAKRPCLILVIGLPGSGKSRLAQELAEHSGFSVVRSDVVRKELANLPNQLPSPPELRQSLYTHVWNERTYAECLKRAIGLLFEGHRVIVDATFREEQQRRTFLKTAMHWGVPGHILLCQADPDAVRQRLENRGRDASDANWSVYTQLAANWEEMSAVIRQALQVISTDDSPEKVLARAIDALRRSNLED